MSSHALMQPGILSYSGWIIPKVSYDFDWSIILRFEHNFSFLRICFFFDLPCLKFIVECRIWYMYFFSLINFNIKHSFEVFQHCNCHPVLLFWPDWLSKQYIISLAHRKCWDSFIWYLIGGNVRGERQTENVFFELDYLSTSLRLCI